MDVDPMARYGWLCNGGCYSLWEATGSWQEDLCTLQPVYIWSTFGKRLTSRTLWAVWVVLMTYCRFQLGGRTLLLSCNPGICLPICNSAINWSMRVFFCHYSALNACWEVPMLGDFKWLFISDSFIIHTWHKHFSLLSMLCYFFSHYVMFQIFLSLHNVRKVTSTQRYDISLWHWKM